MQYMEWMHEAQEFCSLHEFTTRAYMPVENYLYRMHFINIHPMECCDLWGSGATAVEQNKSSFV